MLPEEMQSTNKPEYICSCPSKKGGVKNHNLIIQFILCISKLMHLFKTVGITNSKGSQPTGRS